MGPAGGRCRSRPAPPPRPKTVSIAPERGNRVRYVNGKQPAPTRLLIRSKFQKQKSRFRRQMSLVGIVLFLATVFLISRPHVIQFFRLRDTLALVFIFLIVATYAAAVMVIGTLMARRYDFICPTCGRSLVLMLDYVQSTGKCGACRSQVFEGA